MEPEKKSNGALVGLVIVVIILIVGGIYVWYSNNRASEELKAVRSQAEALYKQDAAALDSLDEDLQNIDTSIGIDLENIE